MKASQLIRYAVIAGIFATTAVSEISKAETFAQKHPRRAQVNKRERRQDDKVADAAADGKITAKQDKTLVGEEKGIKAQERAEVKANGGYLTKGEQKQINGEMNGVNRQLKHDESKDGTGGTFAKDHPRRAEVNRREIRQDDHIANADKSGKITAGQDKTLMGEEKGIKAQERAEVKANGGYLTKGEQKQLNGEMNGVNKQIKADEASDK